MKKYLALLIVIFISVFSFSGNVFAQTNLITISSASAILSNTGYISNAGKSNIFVSGTAPSGSTVVVTLTDSAIPANIITSSKILASNETSYLVGLDGTLAIPAPLHDGLIKVSAHILGSTPVLSAETTVIQETALPTITILGANPFYCHLRNCVDLGVIAYDVLGNKVTNISSSSNIKTNIVGDYSTRYYATDLAGNQNMITRRVSVVARTSNLSTTTVDLSSIPVPTQTVTNVPTQVENIVQSPSTTATQEVVTSPLEPTVIMVSGIANSIKRQLKYGLSGPDVKLLQTVLSHDSVLYPEGLTSGYYGNLTKLAVQRFQEKYGVASKGAAGYGEVGSKTKAKLMEVYGM